jgi:hypothetical protein
VSLNRQKTNPDGTSGLPIVFKIAIKINTEPKNYDFWPVFVHIAQRNLVFWERNP